MHWERKCLQSLLEPALVEAVRCMRDSLHIEDSYGEGSFVNSLRQLQLVFHLQLKQSSLGKTAVFWEKKCLEASLESAMV